MSSVTLLFGAGLFLALMLLFLYLLTAQTSPQSAMLEQVALERRLRRRAAGVDGGSSSLVEWLAKPLGKIRGLLLQKPDPVVVRRLANAGYRQQAHIDIFLGARLAAPAVLCVFVAIFIQESLILFLVIAAV